MRCVLCEGKITKNQSVVRLGVIPKKRFFSSCTIESYHLMCAIDKLNIVNNNLDKIKEKKYNNIKKGNIIKDNSKHNKKSDVITPIIDNNDFY